MTVFKSLLIPVMPRCDWCDSPAVWSVTFGGCTDASRACEDCWTEYFGTADPAGCPDCGAGA